MPLFLELREALGWTQTQLAREIKRSQPLISEIEQGNESLGSNTALRMKDHPVIRRKMNELSITVEDLLRDTREQA